ncbi:MAG TPA: hypothetical protein VF183_06180 [Acidimicrobiales bacterium]
MADRRRNRPATDAAATDDGSDLVVDAETAKALALFNQRLAAQQEAERAQRRIERATKAKDDAAARVRALENDPKATREQRNEAAAAYRAALEAWERAKKGDPEPTGKQEPSSEPEAAGEPEPDGEARGSAV